MTRLAAFILVAVLFAEAAPLHASTSASVPEPSDLALFALGLLGVIIGRHGLAPPKD